MAISLINRHTAIAAIALVVLAACGGNGESEEPSAAQRALDDLQAKYDELAGDRLDDPVEWASEDLENIGDWEYKVVDLSAVPASELETLLNELGNDRWELVWVDERGGEHVAIMKRPSVSLLSKIPLSQLGRLMFSGSGGDQ